MVIHLFFVFSIALTSIAVSAAEIDSFTSRNVALPDAASAINAVFNDRIAEGVANANMISQSNNERTCDKEVLYTELRKAIFQSWTASWGLKGYALDTQLQEQLTQYSYQLSLNDSVYRDLNYLEAFSLNLKELSDVVRINHHLVGIDKLGHFFAEGWHYFEMTTQDQESLSAAMSWGRDQERGKFGYITTGIFSFADLTANFNGWRFWNRVLKKEPDPVKGTFANWVTRPYISCAVQWRDSITSQQFIYAWTYHQNFDIRDYVDGAWDEAQNCNSYADPVIENKVMTRIDNLGGPLQCPLTPSLCRQAKDKYGHFSKWLLHPQCLTRD